jgi:hypothetical protein
LSIQFIQTTYVVSTSILWTQAGVAAWYIRFTYLQTLGFTEAKSVTALFIFRHGSETVYLLLYIDDIVLTGSQLLAMLFFRKPSQLFTTS